MPFVFLFLLTSCASKPKYITDSSDYTSFGIDYHDIENMLDDNVKSFLGSDFVKNLEGKKVLVIANIENLTDDDIDIELLSRKFARQIRNSKKFVLTNAIAGSGSKKDKMIKDSRALRNDEEYDQYTTKEKGNLLSPDYSLAGKITQRTKNIGKKVRVDYQFLLVLTDLKTGVVLWDNEEIISKVIARDKLQEFDGMESKQNNTLMKDMQNQQKNKQYSYTGEKTKEFFRNAGYKAKEFLAKSYDMTKNFILGFGHKNHIVLGMDLGLGGGRINMPPIDFKLIRVDNNYWSGPTTKTENHTLYMDDFDSSHIFIMPINVRVGYLRDIGENWAFALNFIYNYTVASFDSYKLEATTYSIEFGSKKLTSTIQRLGGEILIYYKLLEKLHIFVGSGVLKDISSKYNLSFEIGSRGWYEDDISINVQGQKRFNFESKIDSWYPIVKIGGLFIFGYFGIDSTIYCSWATKERNYLGTNCGVSIGGQIKY
ncbi:penicillin-binding protein activator LpoB [Helicobacter macacae]|nr:penicillin-binding protein activator LpoB [Helicobacter macacae]